MTTTSAPVFDAEVVLACQNELGEGILWDERTQLLHWVDIDRAEVHSYDPETKAYAAAHYGETGFVTALSPRVDGPGLVAATESTVVLINPPTPSSPFTGPLALSEERSTRLVSAPLSNEYVRSKLVRFNDGACDARGRLWIGSMTRPECRDGKERGELWRVDPDGMSKLFLTDIGTSNGIDWSPDNTLMYYIDSNEGRVTVFDYDLEAGVPSNRRVFATAPPVIDGGQSRGVFDGLVIDGVGNIWVARWADSRVVVYKPDGTLLAHIRTPGARSATIPCFGGKDLTTLYIATASADLAGEGDIQADFPASGDVFKLECGPDSAIGQVLGPNWTGRVRHRFGG